MAQTGGVAERHGRFRQRLRRAIRVGVGVPVTTLFLYGLVLAFPQPLFGHVLVEGSYRVYAQEPIDPALRVRLAAADARLKKSEIYAADVSHRVFLPAGNGWFAFFANTKRGAVAVNYPYINNIFLAPVDIARDRFLFRDARVSDIITHEAVHTLTERRLGYVAFMRLPFWKREGYAEYVADAWDMDLDAHVARLLSTPPDSYVRLAPGLALPRHYFRAHALVRFVIDVKGLGFDGVMSGTSDDGTIEMEMLAWARERVR